MNTVRIGTRKSPLALWQAGHVRDALVAAHPGLAVELVEIVSEGDRTLDVPLWQAGGKGLFLKELEQALAAGEIDLAVHSVKDMTVTLPDGLALAAYCRRADPHDALVSGTGAGLAALPAGARIGTCSLRRQCQLRAAFPRLEVINLRGNVNTRLARLDAGQYEGIILAAVGLARLGLDDRITERLTLELCLPAGGQGVIGIETRAGDRATRRLVHPLNDAATEGEVRAERAANAALGGGCHAPIALFAEAHGTELSLRGLVGALDGTQLLRAGRTGPITAPEALGQAVARDLLDRGAGELLAAVHVSA